MRSTSAASNPEGATLNGQRPRAESLCFEAITVQLIRNFSKHSLLRRSQVHNQRQSATAAIRLS